MDSYKKFGRLGRGLKICTHPGQGRSGLNIKDHGRDRSKNEARNQNRKQRR